ncbi:recombinase family protein [Mesorhizobium australicum]|uniref:recombinase family protein n=1 Tax=Mesorhizobium australicum TaxID=536018 RepID=UPI00333C4CE8
MFGRDGLSELMEKAKAGQFEIIIVEALDRLSRDLEDLAGIHKRLQFVGVQIRAVNDGPVDSLMIGLRGLVGQMQREDGAKKVRRGMAGVVREGRSAGGRAYGYHPIPGKPGELEIVEAEAEIIRRVFAEYLAGNSPRRIAHGLNRSGIVPPRGNSWNASTIGGNPQRGYGILNNELYVGRVVWNKVRMVKNPDTGKRVSRINAPEERQAAVAPPTAQEAGQYSLRAAEHLMRVLPDLSFPQVDIPAPQTARESGTCPDPKTCYLETVEAVVISALTAELREPRKVTLFIEAYVAERKRLVATSERRRSILTRQIAEKQREIDRIVVGIAKGLITPDDVGDRVHVLRAARQQFERELEIVPKEANVIALHPYALAQYEAKLGRLREELQDGIDNGNSEGANAIRELVDSVTVFPSRDRQGAVSVEIRGRLNALVGTQGFGSLGVVNDGSGRGT